MLNPKPHKQDHMVVPLDRALHYFLLVLLRPEYESQYHQIEDQSKTKTGTTHALVDHLNTKID